MAGLKRMHAFSLLLFFLFSLSLQYFADGHRKLSPTKLPNRVLMSAQSSNPNFYNAFDTSFQNPGSMYTNTLTNKNSVNFNDNIHKDDNPFTYKDTNTLNNKDNVDFNDNIHKDDNPFTYKDSTNKALSSNNYAFYPHTYNNNKNFADPTSDYKADRGKYSYPTSSSYGGQKLPPYSNEESFSNKESNIGKESSSFNGQQGLYNTPYGEKSFYVSPSNEKSWYTSPPSDKNLYASSSNEQSLHSSSPSYYKANYPFNANESPSTSSRVSDFDEFAKSHPVSNYDSYFNHPSINKNLVHTSSLGHPTFPSSDHDLTYGQVQVP